MNGGWAQSSSTFVMHMYDGNKGFVFVNVFVFKKWSLKLLIHFENQGKGLFMFNTFNICRVSGV